MSGAGLRSVEEIAREMVQEPRASDTFPGFGVSVARAEFRAEIPGKLTLKTAREFVDCLRLIIASAITRAREEGAAAERERWRPGETARPAMSLEDVAYSWSLHTGEPVPAMPLWCSCGKPKPHHGGTLCKCLDCGGFCDLTESEPAAQPRDLAGRIRALALETTGRWVDEPNQGVAGGYDEVLRTIRECLVGLRSGVPGTVQACIDALRREAELSTPPLGEPFLHAADQLEAIIRDCEVQR